MFRKIAVAYNESPEAKRALLSAIQLAKCLDAEVRIITVMAELPAYTALAGVEGPAVPRILQDDRVKFYEDLQEAARALAKSHDIEILCHLVKGREVEAVVHVLHEQKADLLVIGLHQRDLYIARLWSTVYELAQEAPCSVLGVH
jgi:nucleotide-binding universal stress UspA family protein